MSKNVSAPIRQHGAALLSAMLTVTLVATFAAAALWQQYRSIEVEASERARVQVAWLLAGALDWSRLFLRIDGQNPKTNTMDHLGEPWATPFPESRLSTFLAADQNNTGGMTAEEQVDVFLSGQVTDAQSFLNIYNLVDAGKKSKVDYDAFVKLFQLLKLPVVELDDFVSRQIDARDTKPANGNAPLMPQRVRQLTWLGLSPATLKQLTPYITLVDSRTPVNINTASAEVIFASVPNLQLAEAKLLVFSRQSKPFGTLADASLAVTNLGQLNPNEHSVVTNYFQIMGRIRLEQTVVEVQSLVHRGNIGFITTKWRERSIVASPEPTT